jgi:poly-gamma-glutamate capsule biosynthesis protein CapA/YwtB (metallophosphatase superfamily)
MEAPGALRLALTGDSIITRRVTVHEDAPTRALYDVIRSADVAFTNLEVIPNDYRGYPAVESGGSHFAAHAWVVDELVAMGFDLFACAHNHALDYSIEGLLATLETLDRKGVSYAGIGRTLGEARMPTYFDHGAGSVALISCASSFAKGQVAGEQRPDMQGRPGLNPLRYTTTYEVTADQLDAIRGIADALGIEQQRQETLAMGFGFPPDDPAVFPFLDANYRAAARPAITTAPKAGDMDAIALWVREARARADLVVVSLHAHEQGTHREEPAAFIPTFAHRMIDEGADVVIGHGPHLLRGMELYRGKPIFYSLGNLIGQNELVWKLPADSYERFRVDPATTPSEVYRVRYDDDRKGFPIDARFWQTVVPTCRFEGDTLAAIEIVPAELGHGLPPHRRGRPRLAEGAVAAEILNHFAQLSAVYGTQIAVSDGRATVRLDSERAKGERQ